MQRQHIQIDADIAIGHAFRQRPRKICGSIQTETLRKPDIGIDARNGFTLALIGMGTLARCHAEKETEHNG
jgi:hypothetical protein